MSVLAWTDLGLSIGLADAALRLAVALLLGAVIGLDRELRHKSAGLRTMSLVSIGSAGFMLLGAEVAARAGTGEMIDVTRVVQGVAGGVGFIGAGMIIQGERGGEVHGLTTAATIWLVAAVGLAAGAGAYALAFLIAIAGECALLIFSAVKRHTVLEKLERLGRDRADGPGDGA